MYMESDRLIRDTEIDDWVTALHEAKEGDWSNLHVQGAQMTLQAMAAREEPYTGADLYRVFASSDARTELRESVARDLYTLSEIDTAIWQELSQRAATLTDEGTVQLAEKDETGEDDV